MIPGIEPVANDLMKNKSKKELSHLVYFFGVIIVILAGWFIKNTVTASKQANQETKESLNVVIDKINTLGTVTANGFNAVNKKTDSMIQVNELEHKGINKKMDIFKSTLDANDKKQYDLIDEFTKVSKPTGSLPIKENDFLNTYRLRAEQELSLSNEMLRSVVSDTIKKNDNSESL